MKTFLRILLGIIILVVLIVIVGLILPSKAHVERSLTINAPQEVLFEQVNNLHNWEEWSPWHRLDPAMKLEYSGPLSGTGASYSWNSTNKNVGDGKLTILYSHPYDSISVEMDFMKQGISNGYYLFQKTDSGTHVTWGFDADMGKNPFLKYFGLMMNKYVGGDYEKGLKNLDSLVHTLSPYNVEIRELKDFNYVSIRQNCSWDDVSQVMTNAYGKLMKYIRSSGAEMTNAPYAIYHNIDNGEIDLEMGIPVNKIIASKGNINSGTFNSSKAASVDYYGFYDNLGKAHNAIQDWVMKMGMESNGSPMEFYVTDPSSEPDTSKWLTRIYYPVK